MWFPKVTVSRDSSQQPITSSQDSSWFPPTSEPKFTPMRADKVDIGNSFFPELSTSSALINELTSQSSSVRLSEEMMFKLLMSKADRCEFALRARDGWQSLLNRVRAGRPDHCEDSKIPVLSVVPEAPSEDEEECEKSKATIRLLEGFVREWEDRLRKLGCPGWS